MEKEDEPTLAFINDRKYLKFGKITVSVHEIVRDILYASMLSAGKKVRIAFFYQNDSFDAVIPYCLEMLYQLNMNSKSKRNRVLLFGGKLYSYFKSAYKDSFFGDGNFCNDLFGLGVVTPKGGLKGEKKIYQYGGRTLKSAPDKFLFSSSYSFLPDKDIAEEIAAVVMVPPGLSGMHKIPQICDWCEEHGISTLAIFDPYPTARKLKFYGMLDFIPYGWSLPEIRDIALGSKSMEATPLSNPKRLFSLAEPVDMEFVKITNSDVSSLFHDLNSTLNEIRSKSEGFFERDMLMEAASLSRRLAALSTPLLEYDKEYFGSMFRKPLSERVDNFIGVVESATEGKGFLSELEKAAHYIAEIKSALASSNPKFNEMLSLIGQLVSKKIRSVILIPSKKEANSFAKAISNSRVPITESDLQEAGIEIRSFSADQKDLEQSKYQTAILTTYPFLDKKYLLCNTIAEKIKMVLYPCELEDYKFFNSLYRQIESKFFTKDRRTSINRYLLGKGELKDIKISGIKRKGEFGEIHTSSKMRERPKDVLSVLTEIEKSLDLSAPSVFQESINKAAIDKVPGGGVKTAGLMIMLHTGEQLYVREEKTVQVLSASDDVTYKLAKDLKAGETLILVNRDIRTSLNDLLLEKAEEYPKLKVLHAMVSLWVNALRDGMIGRGHDEEDLLEKMNDLGAKIKSRYTIRNWVNGEVIGPRDPKNILRIAYIYKNNDLKANAKIVASSITKMRGLRRMILRRAKNALIEGENEEIEKLGIDLSDFADAIEFFRIVSIKHMEGIPIENLDKIGGKYEV